MNEEEVKEILEKPLVPDLHRKDKRRNFLFVKGCQPGSLVKENTTLIRDTMKNLIEQGDKRTMTLSFPEVIDQINCSTDPNIEIVKSSTL